MRGNACLLGMVVHIPWCAYLLKNASVGVLKYHKLHVSQDKIVRWRKRFSVITSTDTALATITSGYISLHKTHRKWVSYGRPSVGRNRDQRRG